MKKIIDAIKDFLYNITDYGLIIAVVAIMVAVLSWRFNILFDRSVDIDKEAIASLPESTEGTDASGSENSDDSNKEVSDSDNEQESGLIATVTIPDGSLPTKIADILLNSNLIKDKDKFLSRAVELDIDTKLQSGTYEIKVGTPLDDIIKTIAHVN